MVFITNPPSGLFSTWMSKSTTFQIQNSDKTKKFYYFFHEDASYVSNSHHSWLTEGFRYHFFFRTSYNILLKLLMSFSVVPKNSNIVLQGLK